MVVTPALTESDAKTLHSIVARPDLLVNRYRRVVAAAIFSTLGFLPSVFVTYENFSLAHAVHGVFALCWLLVLWVQLRFLGHGCYRNHRYLGWVSLPVFVGMLLSAGYLLWLTAVPAFQKGAVFRMVYWVDFVLLPVAMGFYALGLLFRKEIALHAGFMCMTSVLLIPPGLGRLLYAVFLYPFSLPMHWFFLPMSLLVIGLVSAVGFSERWRFLPTRLTLVILTFAFFSAHFVESSDWLATFVESNFYLAGEVIHGGEG